MYETKRNEENRSIAVIPVLVSAGAWSGEISVSVTDDASSVMTVTMGSSETGTADSTSVSEVLWVELGSEAWQGAD